jgi:hypothetical protein
MERNEHFLDDRKETRRYWKLKEEELIRPAWKSRYERCYGPVSRRLIDRDNEI